MKTLTSLALFFCWAILGLIGWGSPISWAATDKVQYRFEKMVLPKTQSSNTWKISNITDIAVAPDDSLWIVQGNILQHVSNDGTLIKQIEYGESSYISGITLAKDGTLWITNSHYPYFDVQHLDANGALIKQWKGEGNESQISVDDPRILEILDIATDGSIWGLNRLINIIVHFSADGKYIGQINGNIQDSSSGALVSGQEFNAPYRIKVAPDSTLWLIQNSDAPIRHLTTEGKLITKFGSLERSDAQARIYSPGDIEIAMDGSVWITINGKLQHFTQDGQLLKELSGEYPYSQIALAPNGSLWASVLTDYYVHVYYARQVFHIDTDGNVLARLGRQFKAIIVAGGVSQPDNQNNNLWVSSWQIAQKALEALKHQALKPHTEILFLTAGNTQLDLDTNGQLDDLQTATKDSLRQGISDWAKDSTDVVLFLVGQANAGQFQINATETFTAQELSDWLAELEKSRPTSVATGATGKVTVVIEAPDAGSFVAALARPIYPRIVIASTQAGQPALMTGHGVNSFSYTFWSQVMDGASIKTAFLAAQQAIDPFIFNNQPLQAQGDANGDGLSNQQDADAVGHYCLGICTKTVAAAPAINLPGQPRLTLNAASSLDFNVTVQPAIDTNLVETWALIQPPEALNTNPINALNLEKIPLSCDARQQCTGRYQHFDKPGQYRVHFYALDAHYKLSAPAFLDITIQPHNPSAMPAEYDDQQGLLTLYDVDVDGKHYQATLQYQNGLYRLLTLGLTPYLSSPAANFDATTNLLDIPLVRVYGQDYQASFKLVDNYLFQLLSATPK